MKLPITTDKTELYVNHQGTAVCRKEKKLMWVTLTKIKKTYNESETKETSGEASRGHPV